MNMAMQVSFTKPSVCNVMLTVCMHSFLMEVYVMLVFVLPYTGPLFSKYGAVLHLSWHHVWFPLILYSWSQVHTVSIPKVSLKFKYKHCTDISCSLPHYLLIYYFLLSLTYFWCSVLSTGYKYGLEFCVSISVCTNTHCLFCYILFPLLSSVPNAHRITLFSITYSVCHDRS